MPLRLPPATVLLSFSLVVACGGDGGARDPNAPWVTEVDSTGDTIRVRITGEVPADLVRTIEPELSVGAEDGSEEETFGMIVSITPMPDRGFLAYDGQAEAIRRFDANGRFVKNIGRKGGGPGEFGQVNGIALHADGRILVWDASHARINVYSDTGAFETAWRVPSTGHFGQRMLWSDQTGTTYSWATLKRDSVDFTRGVRGVIRYDATGKVLDSLPYPVWREPPPSLIARSPDGRGMTAYSYRYWPENVVTNGGVGGFVSGPGDPYVFYLTHRSGAKPVRVERDVTPVPVSETERAEFRAFVQHGLRRIDPNWSWSVADIPATKPAYEGIQVASDGRIWVDVSTPGIPIPEAELPPVQPGGFPRYTTRTPAVYDVFTSDGQLLGRVALPRRTSFYDAKGNDVYGVRRDSLDVQYVTRFRIVPEMTR